MTHIKRLLAVLALLFLAACGGGGGGTSAFGGDAGTGTGGGTGAVTPSAADLVLTLSANSVANNGTESVVATAIAIDANRNTVAGVPVTVSVNGNAVSTPSGATTGAEGSVTATVGIGADRSNRTITVTATSGALTKTAQLQVVDSAGGGGANPSDLLLTLTSGTVGNDGISTVTANVTALDAKRNVLPGVAVSVTVDQGATVLPSGATTASNGVLSAAIGIGADRSNRTITVTATAQGLSARTAKLQVVDVPVSANPTAADLSLSLSASTLDNGGTNTILATATAVDSKRNTLAGIPVTFSVDSSAVATVNAATSNVQGVVTAVIGIGADRSSRVITVTATSGTLTRSASFAVSGAKLTASFSPLVTAGSTGNQIEYLLQDKAGSAMAGQVVSVTGAGLPTLSGVTNANGKYLYTFTAPATATSLSVVATAAGESLTETVTVQAASGGSVPTASPVPQSASLTPSPSVISANLAGQTTNQVELRALFLAGNNQPVQNVRVRFDLAGNVNSSDGVVSWLGGSYAYSDTTGVARGAFTPGLRSSPTAGLTVRACYDVVDFPVTTCPNQVTNTLTVTSEALSVNIRTDNTVGEGTAKLTYIKRFVVMVVDAAGQAKPDVLITPSVDLPSYYKGRFFWNGKTWQQLILLDNTESYAYNTSLKAWQQQAATSQPSCPNEDVNRNAVREAPLYDAAAPAPAVSGRQEDLNWNGDLDPRKADVAIKMVGSSKTDASGLAVLQIEYGKNVASWVDYVITVTATGISGTEARARYSGLAYGLGNLPFPAVDVGTETIPPAFVISPYGLSTVCSNPN